MLLLAASHRAGEVYDSVTVLSRAAAVLQLPRWLQPNNNASEVVDYMYGRPKDSGNASIVHRAVT
jgi:hypothetical protein